jgi:phosphoglycerol transferase
MFELSLLMFELSLLLYLIGMYGVYRYSNRSANKKYLISIMGIGFLYILSAFFYLFANYFTGNGINEAVWYHIASGIDFEILSQFWLDVLVSIVLLLLSFTFLYIYYTKIKVNKNTKRSIKVMLFEVVLVASLVINPLAFAVYDLYNGTSIDRNLENLNFSDFYLSPTIQPAKENHPNFVYIYIESFERTFLNENIFPGLALNLKHLELNHTSFTNMQENFGTGWTAAGIVSSQCGIPLVGSDNGYEQFYKNAVCLTDLLHSQDYFISLMQGSSLSFAGLDKFYKTHSFDKISGKNEIIKNIGFTPALNKWGLYDDVLLEQSFSEFELLSRNKKNFGLFISTIDTHAAYGYQSKSCANIKYQAGFSSMLNAVKCTDHLISNFIKKIQNSKYSDNTVIILSSDHLMMRSSVDSFLSKGDRKNLFIIIDPKEKNAKRVDKAATMFDVGPTLLHTLGFESSLGLGRNLFLDTKSLSSTLDNYNAYLKSWTDRISEFWDLIHIDTNIYINKDKGIIKLNQQSYQLPIMIAADSNLKATMFFDMKDTVEVNNFIDSLNSHNKCNFNCN